MIANRPDWCISRQRSWGVPLPFFLHKETGELHPRTMDILDQAADIVEAGGIEAWSRVTAEQILGRRGRAALQQEQRHPRGLVRLRLDLLARAARHARQHRQQPGPPRQRPRGRPVPGRPRPAPRLVPQLAAAGLRHLRPRALPRLADPRLHRRQPGPQDEQEPRQRHRAAGGEPEAGRRDHPPVGGGQRLFGRHRRRRQDPGACGRRLPAHPQHAALPAGQHQRLRCADRRRALRADAGDRPLGADARRTVPGRGAEALRGLRVPPGGVQAAGVLHARTWARSTSTC